AHAAGDRVRPTGPVVRVQGDGVERPGPGGREELARPDPARRHAGVRAGAGGGGGGRPGRPRQAGRSPGLPRRRAVTPSTTGRAADTPFRILSRPRETSHG